MGVLALQGSFAEHAQIINKLGYQAIEVRLPEDLESLDSLIIPGGESTTIYKLAKEYALIDPIVSFAKTKPIWGTCAGLILIAREVKGGQGSLNLIDITVERNAFGRQLDSFIADLNVQAVDDPDRQFPAVFIRAPIIESVGEGVDVIASLPEGQIVAAREGKIFVSCFHPELTKDVRLHEYFLRF